MDYTRREKSSLRLKYSCKFPGCRSGYYVTTNPKHRNKHFYKFPPVSKSETLKAWKLICKIDEGINCNYYYVCEDHFHEVDFVNFTRHRLNPGVIPKHMELVLYQPFPHLCYKRSGMCGDGGSSFNTSDTNSSVHEADLNAKSEILDQQTSPLLQCTDGEYSFSSSSSSPVYNGESSLGVMGSGVSKCELTPKKQKMYKLHRTTVSKVCKLKKQLQNERNQLKILKELYDDRKFQLIEEELNEVTKNFINSQLRNANKQCTAVRWSVQDKAFALSIYKRSPRLYRYLATYFSLPSVRLLKSVLSHIPFDTGLNPALLNFLAQEVRNMQEDDKYCALLFDEMSLDDGMYYDAQKQLIYGYQDLGHLGRSPIAANNALVFMLKGIRRTWKQVVAYYFTANTFHYGHLKSLIVHIISELQKIGFKVVCTVCDQNATNQKALKELCEANLSRPSEFHFIVNTQPIVTIYDVPHLLKNTRNALIDNKIQFEPHKEAKFEYISTLFFLDQKKRFKTLPKLKAQHFNFSDFHMKMKVKVAAAQMSHTVAAAIETYVATNILPSEAMHTAEFVEKIDILFDSLNSNETYPKDGKMFKCALSKNSPHIEMWYSILKEIGSWRIIDLKTGRNKTNMFSFLKGWQITLKSIIFLWKNLKEVGFKYLNLKAFNQDALENFFCCIRQHGIANTNPTCFQFIQALKTCVVNHMTLPFKAMSLSNCETDDYTPLRSLCHFLATNGSSEHSSESEMNEIDATREIFNSYSDNIAESEEDRQALAYVAGYLLKAIDVPDDCEMCKTSLYSSVVTENHLFMSFKENSAGHSHLKYASERVMIFLRTLHDQLYEYLNSHGHTSKLHDNFKKSFTLSHAIFCNKHAIEQRLLRKGIPFISM